MVFLDPYIKVIIQGGYARSPINYFYTVWISTYAAIGCTELCCDVEVDIPVKLPRDMRAESEDSEDPKDSESEDPEDPEDYDSDLPLESILEDPEVSI